jgi:ATP phosphoribosyltransferase
MIRIALPKGRNLGPALGALRAFGLPIDELDPEGRELLQGLPGSGVEILLLKDWDLPVYVEHGVADLGIVGSDVLEELGSDLLVPVRLEEGHSRLSLVGLPEGLPAPGSQNLIATKYPVTARLALTRLPWSAEILTLAGSVELAPLLRLADLALDIVQTGATLRAHGLVELQMLRPVAPCVVVNRGAFQEHRATLNRWLDALEGSREKPSRLNSRSRLVSASARVGGGGTAGGLERGQ